MQGVILGPGFGAGWLGVQRLVCLPDMTRVTVEMHEPQKKEKVLFLFSLEHSLENSFLCGML